MLGDAGTKFLLLRESFLSMWAAKAYMQQLFLGPMNSDPAYCGIHLLKW